MILRDELPPGHKLPPERELAQAFNVNRGTLREALKMLESLKLVEIRHGDGIYVLNYLHSTNLDLLTALLDMGDTFQRKIIRELLELKKLIAPEMACIVAKTRNDECLKTLEKVVQRDTGMTLMEKDIAVHRIVAEASGNLPYLILLNFFNAATPEMAQQFFDDEYTRTKTEKFHKDLYEAIKNRRHEAAKRIMVDALAGAARRMDRVFVKREANKV